MRLQVFGKQISFTVVLFLRSSIEESERVDYLSRSLRLKFVHSFGRLGVD